MSSSRRARRISAVFLQFGHPNVQVRVHPSKTPGQMGGGVNQCVRTRTRGGGINRRSRNAEYLGPRRKVFCVFKTPPPLSHYIARKRPPNILHFGCLRAIPSGRPWTTRGGRGYLQNGRSWTRGTKKWVFGRTSLMDDPLFDNDWDTCIVYFNKILVWFYLNLVVEISMRADITSMRTYLWRLAWKPYYCFFKYALI